MLSENLKPHGLALVDEPAPKQKLKEWISPLVSESPVNEFTKSSNNIVWDGAGYS